MDESPIFIVGCPRSGTTLLRDLLRSHPSLTFPGESHFIPKFYKAYGDPGSAREAQRIAARILYLHLVRLWNLGLEPSAFSGCRSYREIVCRLFGEWAEREKKPRWGDKTPHYVMEIPALLELFPDAKILHIYRDGRDVALSWLRGHFELENLYSAAVSWRRYVSEGRRVGATLPEETYLEVRYETLLASPQEVLERVCAFLNEPFAESVLAPSPLNLDIRPATLGLREPLHISRTEIVGTNMDKWKTEMTTSDLILFESMAGDLLVSLGYETEGVRRRIALLEEYKWKVDNFLRLVLQRLTWGRKTRWVPSHLLMQWAALRARLRSAWPSALGSLGKESEC